MRRCRAYHDAVVRRLEEPESEPAEDEAPDDIYFVGLGRKPGEQKEPAGHDGESDASQQSCMYAFDEYACERRYDHDAGRPGRHDETCGDGTVSERMLEIERQGHHGRHLGNERTDGGEYRNRKYRYL